MIALVASTCCGSVGDLVIWSQLVLLRAGDTRTMASTSSTSDDLPFWVEACRTLAPAAAWVVFLSPFSTIRGVARSKSVGGLPALLQSGAELLLVDLIWLADQ